MFGKKKIQYLEMTISAQEFEIEILKHQKQRMQRHRDMLQKQLNEWLEANAEVLAKGKKQIEFEQKMAILREQHPPKKKAKKKADKKPAKKA